MKWRLLGCAIALVLPVFASAEPVLKFDDPLGPGGMVTYGAGGGPAIGTNLLFQSILGLGTPANDMVQLTCLGCVMSFETGPNTGEAVGGALWFFAGGGEITIVGAIPELGIGPGTTILSGTFTGTQVQQIGIGGMAQFAGQGFDTNHSQLAAFYGLPAQFGFATTAIQLALQNGGEGSFSGTVENTDLNNIAETPVPPAQIPSPATMLLIGCGLLSAWLVRRPRGW
jgi:hypothetical protein